MWPGAIELRSPACETVPGNSFGGPDAEESEEEEETGDTPVAEVHLISSEMPSRVEQPIEFANISRLCAAAVMCPRQTLYVHGVVGVRVHALEAGSASSGARESTVECVVNGYALPCSLEFRTLCAPLHEPALAIQATLAPASGSSRLPAKRKRSSSTRKSSKKRRRTTGSTRSDGGDGGDGAVGVVQHRPLCSAADAEVRAVER